MPPKKAKAAANGHVKCKPIPEGTIFKGTNKREIIVGKEFAQGGFGRICEAKLVGKSDKLIIKLEPSGNGPLFTEMHVFQRILRQDMLEAYRKKHNLSLLGLPYLVESGMQDEIRFLTMPKYSHCLDHIIKESRSPLKANEVVDILKCLFNAVKYLHHNEYVHADIKAANIMMNNKKAFNEVYLIDFGLAKKVGTIVEKEEKKKAHDGTALFTSTDAHRGCGFTFRGDMEIIANNALFWLTKSLPWQTLFDEEATIKEKNEQLEEVKAAKQKLLSHLSTDIKKLLPDSTAASIVLALYNASKIDINTKPDFDSVSKTFTNAKNKKVIESDPEETMSPQVSVRRGRKKVTESESEEVLPPPISIRRGHKKGIESESEEVIPPKVSVRRGRKKVTESELEEVPHVSSPLRGRNNDSETDSEEALPPIVSARRVHQPANPSHADNIPPSTSRSTRRKISDSDVEEFEAPSRRRAKVTVAKDSDEDEEQYKPRPTSSRRRGRGTASDTETIVAPSSARKPRGRVNSESKTNGIIPGLRNKGPVKYALQSHQEVDEEIVIVESDEDFMPKKTSRRPPPVTTPKLPSHIRNEQSKSAVPPSRTKGPTLSHDSNMTTPSPRKFPVDARSHPLVKKPLYRHEFQEVMDLRTTPPPLSPSPKRRRTRSITYDIENSLAPEPLTPHNVSPSKSKDRRRSRSAGRPFSPVNKISPDVRPIPQPQGCTII